MPVKSEMRLLVEFGFRIASYFLQPNHKTYYDHINIITITSMAK